MQAYSGRYAADPRKAPVKFIYDQLGGITATMAWALLASGIALELAGRLTVKFIALAGIIEGLVAARAIAEDKFIRQQQLKNGAAVPGAAPGGTA